MVNSQWNESSPRDSEWDEEGNKWVIPLGNGGYKAAIAPVCE